MTKLRRTMTKKVELLPQSKNINKGDQEMKDVRICVLQGLR